MPDGGTIKISTDLEATGYGHNARIIVKDTGPGIAEEHLKNIFLPFYSTKKGQENNLGLGLSICYSIAQRYGGTMSAANNPTRRRSFTIIFPIVELNSATKDTVVP
jgi:two-component system sensor histidine kinase PhcS